MILKDKQLKDTNWYITTEVLNGCGRTMTVNDKLWKMGRRDGSSSSLLPPSIEFKSAEQFKRGSDECWVKMGKGKKLSFTFKC